MTAGDEQRPPPTAPRIGIDLGGTKIAGIVLAPDGTPIAQARCATPAGDYDGTCHALADLVTQLIAQAGLECAAASVGIGMPGSISPSTGRVQNANSHVLNGRDLKGDLEARLKRPLRLANDANCFALSEAVDGAAADADSVFGVIIGTGLGGGIVYRRQVVTGPRATAGEWGHNPLPWPLRSELDRPDCWCGRKSCLEAWLSGPGLAADHRHTTGSKLSAIEIERSAHAGDQAARDTLARHVDRFARGLAHVVNILDPDVIVLGGGLSRMSHLYRELPVRMAPHLFADETRVTIRPPRWGDAGGVRGAAWLWNDGQPSTA